MSEPQHVAFFTKEGMGKNKKLSQHEAETLRPGIWS